MRVALLTKHGEWRPLDMAKILNEPRDVVLAQSPNPTVFALLEYILSITPCAPLESGKLEILVGYVPGNPGISFWLQSGGTGTGKGVWPLYLGEREKWFEDAAGDIRRPRLAELFSCAVSAHVDTALNKARTQLDQVLDMLVDAKCTRDMLEAVEVGLRA